MNCERSGTKGFQIGKKASPEVYFEPKNNVEGNPLPKYRYCPCQIRRTLQSHGRAEYYEGGGRVSDFNRQWPTEIWTRNFAEVSLSPTYIYSNILIFREAIVSS